MKKKAFLVSVVIQPFELLRNEVAERMSHANAREFSLLIINSTWQLWTPKETWEPSRGKLISKVSGPCVNMSRKRYKTKKKSINEIIFNNLLLWFVSRWWPKGSRLFEEQKRLIVLSSVCLSRCREIKHQQFSSNS